MSKDNLCPSLITGTLEPRTVKENLHLLVLLLGASDNVASSFVKLCPCWDHCLYKLPYKTASTATRARHH